MKTQAHILSLTVLSLASLATASGHASNYKTAVVADTIGASQIRNGHYQKGIQLINKQWPSTNSAAQLTASAANLCVAYTKGDDLESGLEACNRAVNLANQAIRNANDRQDLGSIALNNRGILKIKMKDYQAALEDFIAARQLKKHTFIDENILLLLTEKKHKFMFNDKDQETNQHTAD